MSKTKQFFQFFVTLNRICISYNNDAATDVRDAWEDVAIECPLHCLCPPCLLSVILLFVCFHVGRNAGNPYIHLISFESNLLASVCIAMIMQIFRQML